MTLRNWLLAGVTAGAGCFALLAWWVMSGGSLAFDLSVRESIHALASPALTRVMIAITTLGAGMVLWPLGVLVAWRLTATGRRRQAIWFGVVVLSADLISQLFKLLFHRLRPAVFFELSRAITYSFPSGHAFMATLFYGMLAVIAVEDIASRPRRRGLAGLTTAAGLAIGFSRVYLGYHYPSDVLGGWALATVWLCLARLAQGGA